MPKVGDKVIIEGNKIGNPRREGTLIGLVGPLINVRWSDGNVSLFKPGAGAVTFAPSNGGGAAKKLPMKAVKKPAAKPAVKVASAKSAAKPAAKKKAKAKKR